ncbi:MAG: hypothetical protein ACI85S_001417 [Pseudohongiellaceae bacterium]|jgi:hypothetical protein
MDMFATRVVIVAFLVNLYSGFASAQIVTCMSESVSATITGLEDFVLNASALDGSANARYEGGDAFELQANAPVYLTVSGQSLTQGTTSLATAYTIDGQADVIAAGGYGSVTQSHQIHASAILGAISAQLAGEYSGTIVVTVTPQLPMLPYCEIERPETEPPTGPMVDTSPPTLNPTSSTFVLWPPNHKMVDIVIAANASDDSGHYILMARVISDEPLNDIGDGNTLIDFTEPVIDQENGLIRFALRSERRGQGNSRIYSIIIVAADAAGNYAESIVQIVAPLNRQGGRGR